MMLKYRDLLYDKVILWPTIDQWPCNMTPSENSTKSKTNIGAWNTVLNLVKIQSLRNQFNIEDVMNYWNSKFYKEMHLIPCKISNFKIFLLYQ
jgi:hypothetical protein